MLYLVRFFVFSLLLWSAFAQAQVRLIQWSDSHSTMATLTQQMMAVDEKAQEFLNQYPQGEVVVVVLGDHISLNPYSLQNQGWLGLEAMYRLKERGHTVLFVPGNHDGFDWESLGESSTLFMDQIKQLHQWGIPVLAANVDQVHPSVQNHITDLYPLKSLKEPSYIAGAVLSHLIKGGHPRSQAASKVFGKVHQPPVFFHSLSSRLKDLGASQVFLAIHQGTHGLMKQIPSLLEATEPLDLKVPLIMTAHDHMVAAFGSQGVLISNGGSHGSFNVIDIPRDGRLKNLAIQHMARSQRTHREIDPRNFTRGVSEVRPHDPMDHEGASWLMDFHQRVLKQVKEVDGQLGQLFQKMGTLPKAQSLSASRSQGGRVMAEALGLWARSQPWSLSKNRTLAMISLDHPLTQLIGRSGPPFTDRWDPYEEALLYPLFLPGEAHLLKGRQIASLLSALKKYKLQLFNQIKTNQLFNLSGRTQVQIFKRNGKSQNMDYKKEYVLVLDPWLSHKLRHLIPQWPRPLGTAPYHRILNQYWDQATSSFQNPPGRKTCKKALTFSSL